MVKRGGIVVTLVRPGSKTTASRWDQMYFTGPIIPSQPECGGQPPPFKIAPRWLYTLTMLEHDEARSVAHHSGLQPERAEVLAQQPGEKRRAVCSSDISLASGSVIRDGKE